MMTKVIWHFITTSQACTSLIKAPEIFGNICKLLFEMSDYLLCTRLHFDIKNLMAKNAFKSMQNLNVNRT